MLEPKFSLPDRSYIHGKWVESSKRETLTLYSAHDDSVVLEGLQCANAADVDVAVDSAEKALPVWKAMNTSQKRAVFLRFADLVVESAERCGYLEAIVVGKPAYFAAREAYMVAEWFRFYAGFIDKFGGECHPADHEGYLRLVRREPYGICASINPFNAPLSTFAFKVAPALAAGNVMIAKVSEYNPLSTLIMGELATKAGFPPGVLNVIVGTAEAGIALSHHMKIQNISFTGSVAVGKQVQLAAANSNLKTVTLELGGKSPFLVFEDADLEKAIANSASNILTLNGQGCILGTRVYVHESLAEDFVAGMKAKMDKYCETLGNNPLDITTASMPLAHRAQLQRVLDFLEIGKKEASCVRGGVRFSTKGCYVEPTIFFKPPPDAEIVRKEIFGPVLCILTFSTEEEAIAAANDTEFGLGAYIFTKSIDRALRVSAQLEAGSVCINNTAVVHPSVPFGGYKSSGVGRENGISALHHFTQEKSVIIKYE
ncbi:uncharacterized protein A1O5_03715 [Cladophialophora psammophila CBS 110553]|uniref:aldehyde dehydrogenase (NAD(+)) n=1 Tax=Cladophialophora psammophila CBS 110553 TaxID=1182543 RepID=W9XQG2_9EURO|nr:uncharacterized protein A1O5_03715 [Cladophialophora psammophila CBS 110553]EXJ72569.1 hypothetical protein A1O5_03715 [Cladophialophora psammophila CBS 110553]